MVLSDQQGPNLRHSKTDTTSGSEAIKRRRREQESITMEREEHEAIELRRQKDQERIITGQEDKPQV